MELPDWITDRLLQPGVTPAALRVALAVFRHGGGPNAEVFPTEGIPFRARVQATVQELAGLSGQSPRATTDAIKELQRLGVLGRSGRRGPGVPTGSYWIRYKVEAADSAETPVNSSHRRAESAQKTKADSAEVARLEARMKPQRAELAGGSGSSRTRANAAGGTHQNGIDLRSMSLSSSSDRALREQILQALRGVGFDSIGALMSEHSIDRIYGALNVVHRKMQVEQVRSPAALLSWLLSGDREFDEPEDGQFLKELAETRSLTLRTSLDQWRSTRSGLRIPDRET